MKSSQDSANYKIMTDKQVAELNDFKQRIQELLIEEPNRVGDLIDHYLSLAENYNSQEDIAEAYYFFGYINNNLGDNNKSIKFFELAGLNTKNPELVHRIHISIGVSYRQIGEYTKAIKSYTIALNTGINAHLDAIYNNMAVIYYHLNELDQAILFSNKAFELYNATGDVVNSLGILNNLGKILTIQKKYDEAEMQIDKARVLAKRHNMIMQIVISEFNLGNLFYETKDYKKSFERLLTAYDLCFPQKNKNQLYSITLLLAQVSNNLKKFDSANEYYKEALILSQEISTSELINSLNKFYLFLEDQKDYERAFHYLKQLHSISSDINKEEKTKELNKARVQFENKEQELKLEKLNAVKELYDQLEVQSLELDAKNKKLENINNDLIHFSYALSHDLREPARLVKSYSDVLTLMLTEKLNEKEKQMFAHLKSGAERMEVLIEDLHRYAVLGVNEDMKKQVDMTKVLEGVIAILQLQIQESGVIITYDPLPIIYSYSTLIGQLFQNLISNAIKYRKAGEQSYISVTYQIVDNMHEIRVLDNGIGIPNSEQARIFRLFKRATNHSALGTGVGLAFCKKIMDKINGNIQVYSRGENSGSEFIISIPIT
jgi:signal transduction histidine kinase